MSLSEKIVPGLPDGLHHDGGGLYLQVRGASRAWIHRYSFNGRARAAGLGSYPGIRIADARALRNRNCRLLAIGEDPLTWKKNAAEKRELLTHSFREAAEEYFDSRRVSRNTLQQRKSRFARLVFPKIGERPINDVDNCHIIEVLKPIWNSYPTAAEEIRRVMEAIIEMSAKAGWRRREKHNPAAMAELEKILQPIQQTHIAESHPALPWRQIPEFMSDLRQRGLASRKDQEHPRRGPPKLTWLAADAMEFLILTAIRRSNALAARWDDIDLHAGIWHIRGSDNSKNERIGTRMKMKHDHCVPLAPAAIEILKRHHGHDDQWVFRGWRNGPITNKLAFLLLREMQYVDPNTLDQSGTPKPITLHGFRSTFTDWAAECTGYSEILADMAIAHKNRTAYRRTIQLDQRRELMNDWAQFCSKPPTEIIPLNRKKA